MSAVKNETLTHASKEKKKKKRLVRVSSTHVASMPTEYSEVVSHMHQVVPKAEASVVLIVVVYIAVAVLRGTIVNRTCVYTKTYIFNHFYSQYLVPLTMVPRNSSVPLQFECSRAPSRVCAAGQNRRQTYLRSSRGSQI